MIFYEKAVGARAYRDLAKFSIYNILLLRYGRTVRKINPLRYLI
jgi:hypothetical protein